MYGFFVGLTRLFPGREYAIEMRTFVFKTFRVGDLKKWLRSRTIVVTLTIRVGYFGRLLRRRSSTTCSPSSIALKPIMERELAQQVELRLDSRMSPMMTRQTSYRGMFRGASFRIQ